MSLKSNRLRWLLAGLLVVAMAGCGSDDKDDDDGGTGGTGGSAGTGGSGGTGGTGGSGTQTGRTFTIQPNANATRDMVNAMIQAAPGDIIEFKEGFFELSSTLQLTNTEDVLIKGAGRDKTVLSFRNNDAPEGILGVNVHGMWIEDLTVLDTGGNGIELRGVDHARIKRVRTIWSSNGGRESPTPITAANIPGSLQVACTDPATLNPAAPENQFPGADSSSPDYTVSPKSGRYGIYPVSSENILIDEAESIGASDAGIYVGQTNTAIIKNSRAAYNVFGFEIENVVGGEYQNNLAECNTGGFLIYDLDGLRQYGDKSRMYGNTSRNNNTYNFTGGGFVGNVPPGSGMITLSYDRIDIFDNVFENNNTGGIIHASYELFPAGDRPTERRIDWYTEGVHIFRNTFRNNGNGLPLPTTNDIQSQDLTKFLPAVVGLKNQAACLDPRNAAACGTASAGLIAAACAGNDPLNCFKAAAGFRGAHIVWDGLLDVYHPVADCPYPKDKQGNDVPRDARGKPLYTNDHPNPNCKFNGQNSQYNAYKFQQSPPHARIVPAWWASCIDADNEFSADSLAFANFNGLKGLELVVEERLDPAALALFPSILDMSAHNCPTAYGSNLPLLPPVVIPPFERSGNFDPQPSNEVIEQLCTAAVPAGQVNEAAFAVNCPTLDQYKLFSDPEDPTSAPNGRGVPFALNTKLFSDYSVKYRVLYVPSGESATYQVGSPTSPNTAIQFPVGTIIAKTFAFANEGSNKLTSVETRLLIKRENSRRIKRWDGLPYIWGEEDGKRVARLTLGGGISSVSWDTTDVDSGVKHTGSTSKYQIPNANQCLSCHANEDADTGSAPIGPKVRFLNRPYKSESSLPTQQGAHEVLGKNQIQYWCDKGLMGGCPTDLGVNPATQIAANAERVPAYNKPGDSGFAANSAQDVEARARAWLEVNCQHCHNSRGFAANTGMYLDSLNPVDQRYGICKKPTATGQEGNGGRTYDIHPGNVADSIMPFRIGPEATSPAARMPPLARSVVDVEGHALIEKWIRDVVVKDESKYPGSTGCN
jgi:uncharacterized repeat protein (TIGR03806 family)